MFENHINILQVCKACVGKTSLITETVKSLNGCSSYYKTYLHGDCVSAKCQKKGQVSHHPSWCASDLCLSSKKQCIKPPIFTLTTDFEEGNWSMILLFKLKKAKFIFLSFFYCHFSIAPI